MRARALGVAEAGQGRLGAALPGPALHEGGQRRRVGGVGVGVGEDGDAVLARRLDEVQRRPLLGPVRVAGRLEVRDLDARPGLAADLDRLRHRLEEPRLLVADVRGVEAAPARDEARQIDDLRGRGVAPGYVLEARREAERPLVERFLERAGDRAGLLRAQRPVHVSHGVRAQRPVPGEQGVVDGETRLLHAGEVGRDVRPVGRDPVALPLLHALGHPEPGERGGGAAAVAGQLRRHALAGAAVRGRVREDVRVGVRVDVDEAGGDVKPRGVDHAPTLLRGDLAERRDAVADDADVGPEGRRAGAVEHGSSAHDEVERGRCGDARRAAEGEPRHGHRGPAQEAAAVRAHGPVCCTSRTVRPVRADSRAASRMRATVTLLARADGSAGAITTSPRTTAAR